MNLLALHPETFRLVAFLGLLGLFALLEHRWPRRPLNVAKGRRWLVNLLIVAADTLAVRLVVPVVPFAMAALAAERGWGLFNLVDAGTAVPLVVSVLALDLVIYFQHRLFHRRVLLWRLHRMHHTDLDLDVSTGTRFHPVEILLSTGIKLVAVTLIGAPPLAVLVFEILLNGTSLFNHANLRLPAAVDRWLRLVVVTPDMHRVHHSIIVGETNSNFGFSLPWWDWLFGSYRAQPRDGHLGMTIGLREWRDPAELGLWSLLRIPFVNRKPGRTP